MPTAPTNANANHGIISTRKQRSLHLIAHIIRKRRDNPPTDSPEEAKWLIVAPISSKPLPTHRFFDFVALQNLDSGPVVAPQLTTWLRDAGQ